ncbi:hypothetical protein [Amaricoccus solimangrovi]|uniref:Uncharacterized protein n=1 Tax=Amaricoccus solimangrovi TaxID=2589815 RepID=A0A501W1C9_9RHOB|nr:hypothetical protein [Amaricoccus solimangrovi]TPE43419.1 hypothetical protein FJM51_23360 [Amaricoccus solimangrovi]
MSIFKTLAPVEELKFANLMAPTHACVAGLFEPFAARMAEPSDDDATVKVDNGGEPGVEPSIRHSRVVGGDAESVDTLKAD